jgi:O-antigen/teichoic acid export membrane protein
MVDDAAKNKLIRRRLISGTFYNYSAQIITLAIGFFLTPFILDHLGVAQYGLWVLVGSFVAYGQLLDLGITSAVIKYTPEFLARGETEQAQKLIATSLQIYCGMGLLAILASVAIAPVFPGLFNVPPGERDTATWVVLVMGVIVGIEIPGLTVYSVLRGLQRHDLLNLLNIISTLLVALATIVVLLLGGDLLAMLLLNLPIIILMQIAAIILVNRLVPNLKFTWRGASRQMVHKIVWFSSSIFISQVGGRLQTRTDEFVISAIMPISAVTPYSIARRLSEISQTFTLQFMKVLMPLASELHAEDDMVRLRSLYKSSSRLALVLFLPFGIVLTMLAQTILTLWVGPAYGGYDYLVLILTLNGLVLMSQWPAGSLLQGMARHQLLALTSLGSGLLNVVISIILVQPLGLTGVALGSLIPTTLECFCFILPYSMKIIGVSPVEIVREVFLPALLPAIPMIGLLYFVEQILMPSSLLLTVIVAGSAILVYLAGYIGLGASKSERETCRNFALSTARLLRGWISRP